MATENSKIIAFPDPEQALRQVGAWLAHPGELGEINDHMVLLIRRALKPAQGPMKMQLLMLLGTSRRPSAADTLYAVMIDSVEGDDIRRFAAVQLCALGPGLEIAPVLVAHLSEELRHPRPQRRANAAVALGWEGHLDAVLDLLEVLYDPEPEVQEAAVEALTNLGDPRIVAPFIERLQTAPTAQQKVILYNLERFAGADERVATTYLNCLSHANPELRLDALSLLTRVSSIDEHKEGCAACLADTDPAVRSLALNHLYHQTPEAIASLGSHIEALTTDPYPEIRERAQLLLNAIRTVSPEQ